MLGGMSALYMVLGAVSLIPFDIGRIAQITLVIGLLGVIGTALSVFAGIVGGLPVTLVLKGLANMAIMLGGMSILYMVLGAVSLIPFDVGNIAQLVVVIGLIGTVGRKLTTFAGIAGAIPITVVLKGLANIALVLGGFGALAYAFSYATKYADQIEEGCKLITKITHGIGEALGSLVGGILEGVTNSLPKVGENISDFLTNLNPLFNLAKKDDAAKIGDFFESLGTGLLALTTNDFLSFFTGGTDFAGLAEDLSQFATQLNPFFNEVAKVDETGLSKAPQLFKSLEGINNQAFMQGGVNDWWNGSIDLANLGSQLSSFSQSIAPFYKAVAGINSAAFSKAEAMFTSLKVINDQAFMDGGVNDFFNGSIDLTKLGKMLSDFASTAGTFWTAIGGWDMSSFTKAEHLFTSLKVINDQAFMDGGVNDWWNGSIDLAKLGSQLSSFATNAALFFTKMDSFNDASKVRVLFSALKDNVPALNDMDSSKLETLGTNLSDFATEIESLFTTASGIDTSGLSIVASALQNFFNVVNSVVIPGLDNLSGSISNTVGSIMGLGTQISSLQISFGLMGASAVSAGSQVTLAMTMIITSTTGVGTAVMSAGTAVVMGMTLMSSASMANATIIVAAFNEIGNGASQGALLVSNGMTLMVLAVTTGATLMVAALTNACAQCQAVLSAFAASGTQYGAQLVSNIAAGITANAGQIKAAIQSAVSSAAGSVSIKVPIKVGQNYMGTNNWAGGLTTINERGGELVDLPSGTRIYPHDKSVTMAFDEGMQTAMAQNGGTNDNRTIDDSVHFHQGAIVIQAQGMSSAEAERLSAEIMSKIAREQRRKALATYRV